MMQEHRKGEEQEVEVTDSNYGQILDSYISDIKHNDRVEKEMRKMELMEKTFRNGVLDFVFPWHMQLGRFERNTVDILAKDKND